MAGSLNSEHQLRPSGAAPVSATWKTSTSAAPLTDHPDAHSLSSEQLDFLGSSIQEIIRLSGLSGAEGAWLLGNEIAKRGDRCQVRVASYERSNSSPGSRVNVFEETIQLHWLGQWWSDTGGHFKTLEALLDDKLGKTHWAQAEWNNFPLGEPAPLGLYRVSVNDIDHGEEVVSMIERAILAARTLASPHPASTSPDRRL